MLAGIFYVLFSLVNASNNCCYVHPNYAGTCVVQPAAGESCGSILAYLNDAGTVGKSYCGNTPIRGGWRQVRCK
jgi:hypothetical protein